MKNDTSGPPVICNEADQNNPLIHCFVGKEDSLGNRKAISDERVRIENIHFFLSGTPTTSITNLSQE
jgi:hypothetical protein